MPLCCALKTCTRIQGGESVKHLFHFISHVSCVGKIYKFSIVDVYAAQLQTRERMFCWILPVGSIVFGHLGPGFPSPRSSAPSRRCATQQLRELPFHRLIELRALLRGACRTTHYICRMSIYIGLVGTEHDRKPTNLCGLPDPNPIAR